MLNPDNSREQEFELCFNKSINITEPTIPKRSGEIEDFENVECKDFFRNKNWKQVDRSHLAKQGTFFIRYLTPLALENFIPAFLLAALENSCSNFTDSVVSLFLDQTDYVKQIIDNFTEPQRDLIYRSVIELVENQHDDSFEYEGEIKHDIDRAHYILGDC